MIEQECESILSWGVGVGGKAERVRSDMSALGFPVQTVCLKGSLFRFCLDAGIPGRGNGRGVGGTG